jgi:protein-tyrosine kinase
MGLQERLPSPSGESMTLVDQMIGEILSKSRALKQEQIEAILTHQTQTGSRFGESAVALGLVSSEDVLYALAQQFHYPYSPGDEHNLNPELITATQPYSKQAETFRAIRGQLLLKTFSAHSSKKALAVISANKGDGKSYFAANIAVALSQLGGRTLVIDADMRAPRIHDVFGVSNNSGLSGIISGRSPSQAICSIPNLPSLFLLPSGPIPPNPIELIERPAFTILMSELVNKFDYVIVDTPAATYGSDAIALAFKCGAAVCVARQGNSKQVGFKSLLASMAADSVEIAGVIANEY